ncbi:MAG: hypothetical protein ACP5HQ_03355 [Thermoprotei archaeon]
MGNEVRFKWQGRDRLSFADLLEALDRLDEGFVLVIDEAQELIKMRGADLLPSLAYSYDNLKVRVVLSGSEMGLLYRFLSRDASLECLGSSLFTSLSSSPRKSM